MPSGSDKWAWLTRRLVEFTSSGSVLIFVTKKANSDELATNLQQEGYSLGLLHGDMDQSERNKVISDFKKKNLPVLVATDVAGEQVRDVACHVICFDFILNSARGRVQVVPDIQRFELRISANANGLWFYEHS